MPSEVEAKIRNKLPFEEDFVDHSGNTRRFRISLRDLPVEGTILEARELTVDGEGYEFEVYSPGPLPDFGQLRRKIRKSLATRYIYNTRDGEIDMTHDELEGRISAGGLIVDGKLMSYDQLIRIFNVHEGFSIHIKLGGPSD